MTEINPDQAGDDRAGILCGTDFSTPAQGAIQAAGAMAARLGEPVHLVHVIDLPGGGPAQARELRWLAASRKRSLGEDVGQLRATGVKARARVSDGRPQDVLAELARDEKPRLAVVASRGQRAGARWLLGSVSEHLAQHAPVPVLVVRDPAPFVAWRTGRRLLKVFVCFNFTATAEAALRWAGELAAAGPCEVVVGLVNDATEDWFRVDGTGPVPFDGNPAAVQAWLERELTLRANTLLGGARFRVRVEACRDQPARQLAAMAEAEKADLLVTGSHQYRGFERVWHASISHELLRGARLNVAVVPLATRRGRAGAVPPPVRHVLVATDFSARANAAVPAAYALLPAGGLVHLVHVIGPGRRAAESDPKDPGGGPIQRSLARLRELVPADATARRIFTQVEVVEESYPAEGICRKAAQLGVDVICLASSSRSPLVRALLGSVARRVVTLSRRPVLLVPPAP